MTKMLLSQAVFLFFIASAPIAWACQQPICRAVSVCDDPGTHLGGQHCHNEESCTGGTCGSISETIILEDSSLRPSEQKCWTQICECGEGTETRGCWVSAGSYGAPGCNCCTPGEGTQIPSQQ
jgi:hypothetical protein